MRSIFTRALLLAHVAVALLTVTAVHAQKVYIYDFLRNDASARAAAMGGSFVTVTNDPVGIYYNPATLNTVDSTQASFTYFKHLLDINSGSATFVTDIEDIGHVGVGVSYNNYGSFTRTDKVGQEIGDFSSNDIVAVLGWGTYLGEGFSAGLNAKMIFSTIDSYGSSALAVDGGLLYVDTTSRVQAGLSVLNLGSQLSSFGIENEPLPIDLRIGVSHQLRGLPLLIALNFNRLLDKQDQFFDRFNSFSLGGEFTLSKPLRLRVGYNNRVRQDVTYGASKGLAGFSAGFGLVLKDYRFDYGFNSFDRLGGLHRISVNAMF
jgi:long-subunit fatty acid transport protein